MSAALGSALDWAVGSAMAPRWARR
jgi:hypothetical protein